MICGGGEAGLSTELELRSSTCLSAPLMNATLKSSMKPAMLNRLKGWDKNEVENQVL